jgi:DNA polymerase-3 subunit gamma/tau
VYPCSVEVNLSIKSMSYQVLARKWRPKTFQELAGQEHVLKALVNALDNDRLHHAYLFTGTRGVGKTTIARILAKCLNCEKGITSEPCGECSTCIGINEGRFIDLIEVDAASKTKVEDTRELLENVQYAPAVGRFKVYLIDEVHMLSKSSFNALLKTLEEPPPHVKFLLATTDPQKLPATVLSRCLQFNLKNMSPERIVEHLSYVLKEEKIPCEEPALWLLGRAADGSMRDAMSLTDQAIGFGDGKVIEADVRNMLGTIDRKAVYDIIDALVAIDGAKCLAAVEAMSEQAPDYISAMEELLSILHRIAVAQAVPDAVDNAYGDSEQIIQLAGQLTAEDVQLFYQIGLNGRRDLPMAPSPRGGFEMLLLRMLAFKPAGIPELPQVGNTGSGTEVPPSVKKPEAAAQSKPAETVQAKQQSAVKSPKPKRPASPVQQTAVATHSTELYTPPPISPAVYTEAKTVVSGEPISFEQLTVENWAESFPHLGLTGVVGNIASHCVLHGIKDNTLQLLLDEGNATLFNESYISRIEEQLSSQFNQKISVKLKVATVQTETPAAMRGRVLGEQQQKAIETMQQDPNVQRLITDFDATLDINSIKPLH